MAVYCCCISGNHGRQQILQTLIQKKKIQKVNFSLWKCCCEQMLRDLSVLLYLDIILNILTPHTKKRHSPVTGSDPDACRNA